MAATAKRRRPAKRRARHNVIARMGVDTDTAIARELGVSISAIAQRRRRLGIARAPDARLNGFPWTRAAEALLGQVPDREVASELGISLVTVERRRLALDLAGANGRGLGRRKRPAKLVGAKYIKAYRAGARVADLARKHGRSATAVRRALARYLRRVESDRSGPRDAVRAAEGLARASDGIGPCPRPRRGGAVTIARALEVLDAAR